MFFMTFLRSPSPSFILAHSLHSLEPNYPNESEWGRIPFSWEIIMRKRGIEAKNLCVNKQPSHHTDVYYRLGSAHSLLSLLSKTRFYGKNIHSRVFYCLFFSAVTSAAHHPLILNLKKQKEIIYNGVSLTSPLIFETHGIQQIGNPGSQRIARTALRFLTRIYTFKDHSSFLIFYEHFEDCKRSCVSCKEREI
jgi:hypothetical protein